MTKIKVEIEVPTDKYCEYGDTVCLACCEDSWGKCYCDIFDDDLKIDSDNDYCMRCDKCKQAEVKDDNT